MEITNRGIWQKLSDILDGCTLDELYLVYCFDHNDCSNCLHCRGRYKNTLLGGVE